jgi:hypothetical protein
MRHIVLLSLLMWTNLAWLSPEPASAAPLTDIVAAQSFTSGSLTFTNFQATLTYNQPPNPSVVGVVTTRQASLADLQLTISPAPEFGSGGGFEVSGFQWEGSIAQSSRGESVQNAPIFMSLNLSYTVSGLESLGEFASVGAGLGLSGFTEFPIHSVTVTAPTGEQASALSCPRAACRFPVALLPVGATEVSVTDSLGIQPSQSCDFSTFTNCGFIINGGTSSVRFFGSGAAVIPEPATWLLMVRGLGLAALSRRNLRCRPSGRWPRYQKHRY